MWFVIYSLKKSRCLKQRRNKILNYTDLINTVCLSSTVQWHEAQTEVYSLLPSGDLCPCWFILYLKHNIICKSRNGLWSGLHVCLWKEKNEESQGMQFSCKWSKLKSILGKKETTWPTPGCKDIYEIIHIPGHHILNIKWK